MKIVHLKLFPRKKCFLFWILLFTLFLIYFSNKVQSFFKVTRSTKENTNLIYVPENHTYDAIAEFKSKLYPFTPIKNPCWKEPSPFVQNMLNKMQMVWRKQVFSKEIPTTNMVEVFVKIQTEKFLKKMSTLRCFPYFYIMSSSDCIRNGIVNILTQHPKIKAPSKIDIDFWPNILTNNIQTYEDYFENPTHFISQNESIITFDASSSTLFQTNFLFPYKGEEYTTADFIHAFNKDVKILVFFHDPISKTYADYLAKKKKSSPKQFHDKVIHSIKMFRKCLQVSKLKECIYNKTFTQTYSVSLHLGIYWVFLERWYRKFSVRQMKLFCIEDYSDDDKKLMEHIFKFILQSREDVRKINSKFIDKCLDSKLPMLSETEKILREFYHPYNEKFMKGTGNMDFLW